MQLYILRHGIAYEREEWDGSDDTRPLTPEGKAKADEVLRALQRQGKLEVEAIWSSPLLRALQTATIAAEVLKLNVKIVESLASGTTLELLEADFKTRGPLPNRLMIVGHEPDLGEIIGALKGDPAGDYAMKKAGIALLDGEFEAGGMKLAWRLAPRDVLND